MGTATGQHGEYRVQLEAFEGPLDLLLYLIRRAEVDIHDIPVSSITEQYLGYLSQVDRVDIELAGEFLVMAATLMEIKSRMLAPAPAQAASGTGDQADKEKDKPGAAKADPRAELVRQLLAYKQYRDASSALEQRFDQWHRRFPAGGAGVTTPALDEAVAAAKDVDLGDLELIDVVNAFQRIMEAVNFDRLGDHTVVYDDTPIEQHAQDILAKIKAGAAAPAEGAHAELPLTAVFAGRTRGEMVGLFIAVLELVRQRKVAVRQDRPLGEILLRVREESENEPAPTPA